MNNKNESRLFIGLLLLAVILFLLFWKVNFISGLNDLSLWLYPDSLDRRGMTLDLVLKMFGGIAILIGLWFGLVRAYASKKSADAQTRSIENQTEELKLSRETQVAELFRIGVEHLASSTESISISGVYELETIARQKFENYSKVVFKILISRLRAGLLTNNNLPQGTKMIYQTILEVICNNEVFDDYSKDLSDCSCLELNFYGLTFENFVFRNTSLPSNSTMSKFVNCKFIRMRLEEVIFSEVNFVNCLFELVKFLNCQFVKGSLDNSETFFLSFKECIFRGAEISGNIESSNYYNCRFFDVNFVDNVKIVHFYGGLFSNSKFHSEVSSSNFMQNTFFKTVFLKGAENCIFKSVSKKSSRLFSRMKPEDVIVENDTSQIEGDIENVGLNMMDTISAIEISNIREDYNKI